MGEESPAIVLETHCGDGTQIGELIHAYAQKIVIVLAALPTFLGPLSGEMLILYLGLCNIPLFFVHYYLQHAIREPRPFNCGNPNYADEYASPCTETLIVWYFTVFFFTHSILRNLSNGGTLKRLNLLTIGRTLVLSSVIVTYSVVASFNNTLEQAILGLVVGCVAGMCAAVYLEFVFSDYIPTLLDTRVFKFFNFVDSVYSSGVKCACKRHMCVHRFSQGVYGFLTNVYELDTVNSGSFRKRKLPLI